MLEKELYIEIDRPNYTPIYSVQYDYNSRFYKISILNQSKPLDLTGLRVVVAGKKPDGEDIFNTCKILDAKKGQIQLELTEQMNAVTGVSEYALELFSSNGMLSSQPFQLKVTKSTIGKNITSSSELSALKTALSEVQNIENRFAQTNEQLSEIREHCTGGNGMQDHSHVNKNTLDKFDFRDDELYFDGKKLGADIEDNSVTSTKIANGSVGLEKTSFLTFVAMDYFLASEALEGYKIVAPANGRYSTIADELYKISGFIPLTDATTPINIYSYGRVAFFDADKTYIDALGAYEDNINSASNTTIAISQYPSLSNAKYIKVCAKKEYLEAMYIKQGETTLSESASVNFKALKLTDQQIDYILRNVKDASLSIHSLKELEFELQGNADIQYEDGYKIAANGDTGYVSGRFNLVVKDGATTTNLIPITANDTSFWEFNNIARISFFDEDESYIDSLYDVFGSSPTPTTPINIFGKFPSLKNTKYVRMTIALEDKENWSLTIDGIKYFKKTTVTIPSLNVATNNLSEDIKGKLSKLEDNSFKNHKDTVVVFEKNKDFSSTHFRIPFMCVTNQGTIIAGCDIRYNSWNDHSLIDLGTARSEDGGKTWIDKTVAIPNPGVSSTLSRVMDGTILATKEGRVFLIGNKFNNGSTGWTNVNTPNDPNWDCVLYHSDDDGRTWQFNQSLKPLLPEGQISFLGGVGSGIQMKNGTLVFPIQMARANDKPFNCQSGIIYSTDNGVTWKMSETLVNEYTSECSIVEYPAGTIIINCRQEGGNHRSVFKTTNLGTTWEETPMNTGTQQTNACQGHMCKIKVGFDKEVILFTNPINDGTNRSDGAYSGYDRSNLSLSILQNDTKFTPIHTLYRPHSDGYSCMAFDERRNRLYVVMELEYNLVFRDLTDLLPTIQLYKNLETIG